MRKPDLKLEQQQKHTPFALVLIGCVLVAGAVATGFGSSAAQAAQLLQTTSEVEIGSLPMTENSFRARLARVDRRAIRAASRGDEPLELTLFDDMEIRAVRVDSERLSRGGVRWHGTPERDPNGSVVVIERRGAVTGSIQVDDRLFVIRPFNTGRHLIEEIDRNRLPVTWGDAMRAPIAAAGGELGHSEDAIEATSRNATDEISNLKVVMLFTGGARKMAGGRAALESLIELGVEQANIALETSKVDAQFELVAIKKVPGKETDNMGNDLDALWYSDDGKFDKAHRLRERYDADFVHLIVDDSDADYCGVAYLPDVKSARAQRDAFGVTRADCITTNTIGHELGHNMGLEHDRIAAQGTGQFRYSFGYCDPGGAFHTIMAYYSSCPSPQLLAYSNPRIRHNGIPVGEKKRADNARSINKVREYLEAFRGPTNTAADPDVAGDRGAEAAPDPAEPVETSPAVAPIEEPADVLRLRKFERTADFE